MIKCPMCGETNPDEAEVCSYCQARLKPLVSAGMEEQRPEPPEPASGETGSAAWLDELRPEEGIEPVPEDDGTEDAGRLTEWESEDLFPAVEPEEVPFPPQAFLEAPPLLDSSDAPGEEEEQPSSTEEGAGEAEGLDLPGWLSRESSRGESKVEKSSPTASWLEEMRPGYDPTPTRPARRPDTIERAGPLAGLRGVLSAEPDAVRSRKTVVSPSQLKITANQRVHADLLKSLLEEEGQPKEVSPRSSISSEYFLRWGILLVLLLVLIWPALTGAQDAPLPEYLEEAAELNRLVNQLPENARVLVGFDYDPGLSAEVEAAASPVVDHLMSRGAYLTLVSTSPTGPVLAERFIKITHGAHLYTGDIQYVNLGYIPGGPVGLLNFVESPQRALPYSLDGVAAWETADHDSLPPLEGIAGIQDFSMIMVLVDDPDTARAWVEQVGTRLNEPESLTSLVMVTSAQVEPMILPYYVSSPRQIHGVVAGLRGGAAYAHLTGDPGPPRRYWDAYGVGLVVAALILLLGGAIYAFLPWLNRLPQARRTPPESREVDG